VPPITGMDLASAAATLKAAGFKMVQLDQGNALQCASSVQTGSVAFYGPQIALPGSTITVCPSSGVGPQQPPAPHVTPPSGPQPTTTPTPTTTRHRGH